jgi:hypothetical protein
MRLASGLSTGRATRLIDTSLADQAGNGELLLAHRGTDLPYLEHELGGTAVEDLEPAGLGAVAQLAEQTRLADARLTDQLNGAGSPRCDSVERLVERGQLACASHHLPGRLFAP